MADANEIAPKKLRCIQRSVDRHWVGDGFPVRTLFAYSNLGPVIDPFCCSTTPGPGSFHRRKSDWESGSTPIGDSRR
jgi:hypothetical protein